MIMETKGVWILETKELAAKNQVFFHVDVFADQKHAIMSGVSKTLIYMDNWELSDPDSPYPEWSDMYADIVTAKDSGDYELAMSLCLDWAKSIDNEYDGFIVTIYHKDIHDCEC